MVKQEPEAEAGAEQGTEATRRLCEEIASLSGGVCFLGFSRGKDSIAAWLWLRNFFPRIIPVHCASVPHLSFVDDSLAYYERWFGTPILRFMDGDVTEAVDNLVYQPPGSEIDVDAMGLWSFSKHAILHRLRADMGLPRAWCAYGINASDSIDRRIYVNKYKGKIDTRKSFYPCYDWTRAMILQTIVDAGIKLPGDYLLASRSMAAVPSYRHLKRMEAVFPDDLRRVELVFPLIRAQLARMEFRERRAAGTPKAIGDHGTATERTDETTSPANTGGRK